MTTNQLSYFRDLEVARSNRANERETERSNKEREKENFRSNLAKEYETSRHNRATEYETARNNLVLNQLQRESQSETQRANLARERLQGDYNAGQLMVARQNARTQEYTARVNADYQTSRLTSDVALRKQELSQDMYKASEIKRSNRASESIRQQTNVLQAINNSNMGRAALLNAQTSARAQAHQQKMDQLYYPAKLENINSQTYLNDVNSRYQQSRYELYPVELGLQAVGSGIRALNFIRR